MWVGAAGEVPGVPLGGVGAVVAVDGIALRLGDGAGTVVPVRIEAPSMNPNAMLGDVVMANCEKPRPL